jgi:hypothetical protein
MCVDLSWVKVSAIKYLYYTVQYNHRGYMIDMGLYVIPGPDSWDTPCWWQSKDPNDIQRGLNTGANRNTMGLESASSSDKFFHPGSVSLFANINRHYHM